MKAVSTKIDVLGELSKRTPSAIVDLRNLLMSQNTVSTTQIAKLGQSCDEICDRVDSLSLMAVNGRRFSKKASRALQRLFSILQDIRRLLSTYVTVKENSCLYRCLCANMLLL